MATVVSLRCLAPIVVAVVAAAALPAMADSYVVSIGSTAIVLATLAASTHLLTGIAGLATLGQAAYLAVGAYTAAILATSAGLTNGPAQLAAATVAATLAAAVTAPLVLRTRGVTYLMVTFAIAEIVRTVASQSIGLTGGDEGLRTPAVTLWPGVTLRSAPYVYWYLLACFLLLAGGLVLVMRSRVGVPVPGARLALVLRGVADHEPRLTALGHHAGRALFAGHLIAAAVAGAGGALLVAAHRYVTPAEFGLEASALALLAAAIGRDSMRGAVAAAVLIIAVRDLLGGQTGGHALALLGLAFLLVAYRPALSRRFS